MKPQRQTIRWPRGQGVNGCDFNLLDTAFAGSENVTMSVIRNVPTSFDCQIKITRAAPTSAAVADFFGRSAGPCSMLCDCPCHAGCPLFGRSEAREPAWIDRCTCPGAADHKDAERHRRELSDQRRALVREAVAQVKAQDLRGREISPVHLRKPSANEDWSSTPTKRICWARRSKSDKCQGRCEIFRHSAL